MILAGRWVRLEPLAVGHREPLRIAADDDRIWEQMTVLARGPGFHEWFDTALKQSREGKRVPWAVRRIADDALVGSTSFLDPVPEHKRVEIGSTWYRPDSWATAVNPECKLLLMTHAFETLGFNRVQYVTDLRNERSQAAIAKLGAKREGVLRSHMITRGDRVRDSVVFAITADEWPQVKKRLVRRLKTFEWPEYDEESVLADYLWNHFGKYFTEVERKAWWAVLAQRKAAIGSHEIAKILMQRKVGDDPAILAELAHGVDDFHTRAAKRVLSEHADSIRVNRCPKCNRVVRTPQAQQCFWCGHDWHP